MLINFLFQIMQVYTGSYRSKKNEVVGTSATSIREGQLVAAFCKDSSSEPWIGTFVSKQGHNSVVLAERNLLLYMEALEEEIGEANDQLGRCHTYIISYFI